MHKFESMQWLTYSELFSASIVCFCSTVHVMHFCFVIDRDFSLNSLTATDTILVYKKWLNNCFDYREHKKPSLQFKRNDTHLALVFACTFNIRSG